MILEVFVVFSSALSLSAEVALFNNVFYADLLANGSTGVFECESSPSGLGIVCNESHITQIIATSQGFSGTISSSLIEFKGLRSLQLQQNELRGTLPALPASMLIVVVSSNLLSGSLPMPLPSGLLLLDTRNCSFSGVVTMSAGDVGVSCSLADSESLLERNCFECSNPSFAVAAQCLMYARWDPCAATFANCTAVASAPTTSPTTSPSPPSLSPSPSPLSTTTTALPALVSPSPSVFPTTAAMTTHEGINIQIGGVVGGVLLLISVAAFLTFVIVYRRRRRGRESSRRCPRAGSSSAKSPHSSPLASPRSGGGARSARRSRSASTNLRIEVFKTKMRSAQSGEEVEQLRCELQDAELHRDASDIRAPPMPGLSDAAADAPSSHALVDTFAVQSPPPPPAAASAPREPPLAPETPPCAVTASLARNHVSLLAYTLRFKRQLSRIVDLRVVDMTLVVDELLERGTVRVRRRPSDGATAAAAAAAAEPVYATLRLAPADASASTNPYGVLPAHAKNYGETELYPQLVVDGAYGETSLYPQLPSADDDDEDAVVEAVATEIERRYQTLPLKQLGKPVTNLHKAVRVALRDGTLRTAIYVADDGHDDGDGDGGGDRELRLLDAPLAAHVSRWLPLPAATIKRRKSRTIKRRSRARAPSAALRVDERVERAKAAGQYAAIPTVPVDLAKPSVPK